MTITDKTREHVIKFQLLALFTHEIRENSFDRIHRLYDAAHITNRMLVEQFHRNTAPMSDFHKAIYTDISYILIDKIVSNEDVKSLFQELYSKVFPKATKYASTVASKLPNGNAAAFSAYQDAVRHYVPSPSLSNLNKPEFSFFVYSLYIDDAIWNSGILPQNIIELDQQGWLARQSSNSDYIINDQKFVFTDTDEPIFQSKMYEKFLERQRNELASYLGVPEKSLSKTIKQQMAFDIRKEDLSFLVGYDIPGFANLSTIHVMQDNHGSATWLQTVTSPRSIRSGSLGFQPDVGQIIRSYYRGRVESVFLEKNQKGQEFLKSTLSRECKGQTVREDYLGICFLYNVNIVYKMFQVILEKYYADFSWEQIVHKNLLTRSNLLIEDLERVIRNKELAINSLNRENQMLNQEILKKEGTEGYAHLQEEQRLNKLLEQKEQEIEELKNRARIQDEYIELLKNADAEAEGEDIDLSLLQNKRYLFVGYSEEINPTLKKVFPNSIFLTNDSTSLNDIQVDAVVLLIRYMSHAMYYRIRSRAQFQDIPLVYCNGRSLNSIYSAMNVLVAP